MQTSTLARVAYLAPLPAIVLEPITASAYFRTPDGKTSGDPAWVHAWTAPLQDALPGLFDWSSSDTVYLTYGKGFALAVAGMLCALIAVRRTDPATSGRFRWAWPAGIAAYTLLLLGVIGEYYTPWTDTLFVAVTVPAMLTLFVASPFLGARMLRERVGSRAGAWMIALTMPALIGLTALGGHLGFPVIWLAIAWMLNVRAATREPATPPALSQPGRSVPAGSSR
ncbi:MAG: hypothetical protein QOE05_1582 [Actinomycetota bacterium]|jgi:hypothetical protein|nr:hypothetical protein [Actinomycetota bacterium]